MVGQVSKEELWRSRLRRFRSSGMSVARFCQSEKVSVPSFYHWRRRLALVPEKKAMPLFMPVHVTGMESAAVEVHLPNGTRVCVPPGDTQSLRVAVETAGRIATAAGQEAEIC
jgi:squalene cyclase